MSTEGAWHDTGLPLAGTQSKSRRALQGLEPMPSEAVIITGLFNKDLLLPKVSLLCMYSKGDK